MDLFDDLPEPSIDFSPNGNSSNNDPGKRKSDDVSDDCKKIKLDIRSLKCHVAERKGEREDMQDAHTVYDNFDSILKNIDMSLDRVSLFCLYDGHGGSRASNYCADNLHLKIADNFPKGDQTKIDKEIKTCFVDSYAQTDKEFLEKASKVKPSWKDGTTAIVSLFINNTIYIASIGDSKAVLYRRNESALNPILLSKDHSPSMYEERLRIQKAGGYVRDGRVMGVLEVSRSIGDGQFKTRGVNCIPNVKKCNITPDDKYIVIACDGLWKAFTPLQVASVLQEINQHSSPQDIDKECENICKKLADEAVKRGCEDNVTVLLLHIS